MAATPRSPLIFDWNRLEGFEFRHKPGLELNDETLRDGLQSPSVKSPPIEDKIRLLHLMDSLGIDTADIGLPGAGPHVVQDVMRLARERSVLDEVSAATVARSRSSALVALGTLILTLVSFISWFLVRRIVKPLGDTARVLAAVASGDLTRSLDVTSQDEIGEMTRGLNQAIDGMRTALQAIAHAADKKALIDGVLLGLGQEATGPYKPGTWAFNPGVKKYPHDPGQAKALLAEAGWKEKDGVLVKDGQPFEFTVLTNAGNDARAKTAAILQQNLAEVGIRMKIRTVEWAAFINEFIDKRKFDAVILGWNITPDPDQFDIWHSSKTGPKELNHVGFANPEVDRLLDEGRSTFDLEKRKKAYFRIQEILAEEQPYVFLYVPEALPVVHNRFRGIVPAPAGIEYNFIKWYVPKALQKHQIQP